MKPIHPPKKAVAGSFNLPLLIMTAMVLFVQCKKDEPAAIEVKTGVASEITYTSARVSGEVIGVGESGLESYGHCWSQDVNPALGSGQKTELGSCNTACDFHSLLTGLLPGTTYYVRSYARGAGTIMYGEELSFSTLQGEVPVVTSSEVSSIDYLSAVCGGTITDEKGSQVIERGVCYGPDPLPDINGLRTYSGSGAGSFTSSLTGLIEGKSYYCRAYATNSTGTGYGEEKYFVTRVHPPSISVNKVYQATSHGCKLELTADGLLITEKGVCYSTQPMPTIEDPFYDKGASAGAFTVDVTGLVSNTTYYIRPFAVNTEAVAYGDQFEITTAPMVFDVVVTPMELLNSCPPDEEQVENAHEAYGSIYTEIEGNSSTRQLLSWKGIVYLYRVTNWIPINTICASGQLNDVSEEQSILVKFDIEDDDKVLGGDDPLDDAQVSYPMRTILDLDQQSPVSSYSGTYTLPRESALSGRCLKMTFRFDYTEKD
jgi:hypothetical protein